MRFSRQFLLSLAAGFLLASPLRAQQEPVPEDYGFRIGEGYPAAYQEAAWAALRHAVALTHLDLEEVVGAWDREGRTRPVFTVLEEMFWRHLEQYVESETAAGDLCAAEVRDAWPIEARIADSALRALTGSTIIELDNGQVWQQTDGQRKALAASTPRVQIAPSSNGYLMRFEHTSRPIAVRRIHSKIGIVEGPGR